MAVPESSDASNSSRPSSSDLPLRPSWETARPLPAYGQRPPLAPAPARQPAPGPVTPAPPVQAVQSPATCAPAPQAPLDSDTQYDLAGNALPGSAGSLSQAPAAASGYSAGSAPTAGVWPPPVTGGPGFNGAQAYQNNSGAQSHLPPEIERLRWHWGAFFFPTFWSRRHGLRALAFIIVIGFFLLRMLRAELSTLGAFAYIAACVLVGTAHLGVQVYFGMNGHKIGWRNRHFPGGLDEYFKVQSRWMWWGFAFSAFGLLLGIAAIGSLLLGHPSSPGGYGTGSYGTPRHSGSYGASSSGQ